MKPIKLKISAFGPYKNEVDINFKKLGDNGIFLITGDTGAGKTTIFDAICFALFGEVSGSNRTVDSLRSDFATFDVKTFVELEFTHKNKSYKIERSPKYLRQKKSGTGTTPSNADASLVFDDIVVTGFKEVTERVIQILGINVKQFKQIAMLAQGEFLQLLFADANERSNIFRKIFETNVFYSISDKLRIRTNKAKSILDDRKLELGVHIKNSQWDSEPDPTLPVLQLLEILNKLIANDKLKELEYKNIKNEYQNILDNVKKELDTSQYINRSIDELEVNKNEFKKMVEDKDRIDNDIVVIKNNRIALEKINPIKKYILKVTEEIADENENIAVLNVIIKNDTNLLNILKVNYDCLNEKEKELKVHNSTINKLSEKLPLYNSIEELNKGMIEEELNLKKITEQYNYINENNSNLEIDLEKNAKLLNENSNVESSIKFLEIDRLDISRQVEVFNQVITDIIEVKQLENDSYKEKEQFVCKQKEYDEIQSKYNDLEMKFLSNQAGILSSKLEIGCPCTVCR